MLYSKIYNYAYSDDLRIAYSTYDSTTLLNEVKRLSGLISEMDETSQSFVDDSSRLLICLALVDSLKNKGAAFRLMSDVINF